MSENKIVTTFPNVTIVNGEDWSGVYLGNLLWREGHSVDWEDLLEMVGVKIDSIYADCDWLCSRGTLPEKLSDVMRG